jgi:outer membrane protein TolC
MRTFTRRLSATVLAWFLLAVGAAPGAHAQQPPGPASPPSRPAGPALELTMARAVELALESNLGLESDRMNVETASHGVALARASFLPQLVSQISRSSSRSVPSDFTQGAADITSQGINVNTSVAQSLPFLGTSYGVSWNSSRNSSIGGNPLFNPSLGSSFSFNVTQPLWRGLAIDEERAGLTISQRQRINADVELQQQVTRLEATVRNAYLNLISAIQGLRVAEQNLEIVQTSLANARARVEVGAAAPIELISAEADVASNQERVLVAQAQIATVEDELRTLILDPDRPDYWQVRLVPTDTIQAEPRQIDLDAAIGNALGQRLDLAVLRRNLEIEDLQIRLVRDSTRPAVNLNLSYLARGSGGTRFTYGEGFPPPVVGRNERSFASVLGDAFGNAYPNWTVGVNVAYPVGRSAQDANYARAQVGRRQTALGLRQLELAIVQQVRDAARQVENSYQRVLVTRAALQASEQQLDAEQRRFAAGLSTNLELQVRQQQLAQARVNELNAAISYNRALIEFERVQKTQ